MLHAGPRFRVVVTFAREILFQILDPLGAAQLSNPELADYIRRLEQVYDQAEGPQPDMNTDAIVDEIQQFLRRRRDNPLGNDL